jgi:hypothetical protein
MEVGMVIVSSPTGTTGLSASNAATSIQELVVGNQSGDAPSSYNDSIAAEAWGQFNKIQSDLRKIILLLIEICPKQCGKICESNDQSKNTK